MAENKPVIGRPTRHRALVEAGEGWAVVGATIAAAGWALAMLFAFGFEFLDVLKPVGCWATKVPFAVVGLGGAMSLYSLVARPRGKVVATIGLVAALGGIFPAWAIAVLGGINC